MAAIQLLVIDSASPTTYEGQVQTKLQGLGHTVALRTVSLAPDATGQDVIVLPDITNTPPAAYKDLAVPLMYMCGAFGGGISVLGLASGRGVPNHPETEIQDAAHPLAAGLTGSITMYTSGFSAGPDPDLHTIPAGAELVSRRMVSAGVWGIIGYETGATLTSGTAPARRTLFGWGRSDTFPNLTANADTLFQAQVDWLVAAAPSADPAGLGVTITGSTADLSWTASPTGGVTGYSIFRRTPQTGAAFNPNTDTPIATGVAGTTYSDTSVPVGDHEWQVFGEIPG